MSKIIFLTLIALFAILVPASPLSGTNKTTGSISWIGKVPGHGEVTLHGTTDDVQDKIFEMAPHLKRDYYYTTNNENPFMTSFPLRNYSITDMTATGNGSYSYNHSVVTRSDRDGGKNINDGYTAAQWFCGTFATGSYEEFGYLINRIAYPGGLEGGYWKIGAAVDENSPTCVRLTCATNVPYYDWYGNTAVYWCNDNPYDVLAPAIDLAAAASWIAQGYDEFDWTGCCLASQNRGSHNQFSGQLFIGNGTNINVGWGDCRDTHYFRQPTYYPYPGEFGVCS